MCTAPFAIVHSAEQFSHTDACRVSELAALRRDARTVVIDLKHVRDAATSAFARLVLLRRELLRSGRDLVLVGLRDRAADVFSLNRLATVLPCA